jgi:hypothetical protein
MPAIVIADLDARHLDPADLDARHLDSANLDLDSADLDVGILIPPTSMPALPVEEWRLITMQEVLDLDRTPFCSAHALCSLLFLSSIELRLRFELGTRPSRTWGDLHLRPDVVRVARHAERVRRRSFVYLPGVTNPLFSSLLFSEKDLKI